MGKAGCNKDIAIGTFEAPTARYPSGRKFAKDGKWKKVKPPSSTLNDDQRAKRDEENAGRKR